MSVDAEKLERMTGRIFTPGVVLSQWVTYCRWEVFVSASNGGAEGGGLKCRRLGSRVTASV